MHTIPTRLFLTACVLGFGAATLTAASFRLTPSAALQELAIGPDAIALSPQSGGFSAYDVTNRKALRFAKGAVTNAPGRATFASEETEGLTLHAEFTQQAGYVLVQGRVENRRADPRALVLDYRLGLAGGEMRYSNSLNSGEDRPLAGLTEELEGNCVPVAALTAGPTAVAMAIPPDEPRIFGMVGSAQGLATRFYLGLSPAALQFPNRATFAFIIYPSEAAWGFRSALAKYYDFYPERYQVRAKRGGLWLFQVKGIVPENVRDYAFNIIESHRRDLPEDLQRDADNNIVSLLYSLPGQRELKFLDAVPRNYDEAMEVLKRWTPDRLKLYPFMAKECAAAGGDVWLLDEITNSAVKDPAGRYEIVLRDTPWGKNSVSFRVNPSPYLYADTDRKTVGKHILQIIADQFRQHPRLGGVLLDSFGGRWPAVLDYRPDHVKYARYPLTFGPKGLPAVYNDTAHYELTKALKEKLDAEGKLVFANGIDSYWARPEEHYRAQNARRKVKIGRFFDAALLDGATCERGAKSDTPFCQDLRVFVGRKYYSLINYRWTPDRDPDTVEEFFNRALCYGIFASNTKAYPPSDQYEEYGNEGVSYVDNPQGYFKYRELTAWFVPKARLLHEAGWSPVTHARASGGPSLYVERFGSGSAVYFTVLNDSGERVAGELQIDLPALGFAGTSPELKELAQGAKPEVVGGNRLRWTLEPHKTYLISLTKRGSR